MEQEQERQHQQTSKQIINDEAKALSEDLKNNSQLADGNFYSSEGIEAIIKRKHPGTNKQTIKLAIDMLQRDVEFFSSKVVGDRFDNARLVIAARRKKKPTTISDDDVSSNK